MNDNATCKTLLDLALERGAIEGWSWVPDNSHLVSVRFSVDNIRRFHVLSIIDSFFNGFFAMESP